MRPKFVVTLLLLAALILGGALLLKPYLGSRPVPPPEPASIPGAPAVPPAETSLSATAAPPPEPVPASLPAAPVVATKPLTPEQRQAAINAEVDRLYELAAKDDSVSLSNILADLTNTNKEIREAAIEATKEFGSTDAIPALKAAADATDDISDKIAYLEAVDFLNVPPFDPNEKVNNAPKTPEQIQLDQQKQAAREARRLRGQRSGPDQNSQSPPANSQDSGQSASPNP